MMHKIFANYGDKNFLEYGTAVEVYINDQLAIVDTDDEIRILYCRPFDDDDVYLFADCTVNINDTWIDKKAIMEFSGLDKISTVNEQIQFAIACIEYYGVDNFSSPYGGYKHDCNYIKEYFRYHVINEKDFTLDDIFQ